MNLPTRAELAPSPPTTPDPSAARRVAVAQARAAWATAPAHVKVLAGAYVGPLLDCLAAIGRELDAR